MKYYILAFKNYVNFTGRTTRKEFWMFTLISTIISVSIAVINGAVFGFENMSSGRAFGSTSASTPIQTIGNLYSYAVHIPTVAIAIRRFHDIDKGWGLLFVPIYNIVLLASKGTVGPNKHGDDPLNQSWDANKDEYLDDEILDA